MRSLASVLLLTSVITFLASCGGDRSQANLPKAAGLSGDMYVVMDSVQWQGPLGALVDSLFSADMDGLPRPEPIFNLKWVDPRKLNFVLKQRRNLIFVMTLDNRGQGAAMVRRLFTQSSIDKIRTEPGLYLETATDLFALGQDVMFLFGNTEGELIDNVQRDGRKLVEFFNRREREKLMQSLYKSGEVKGIGQWVEKSMGATIRIPFGYKLAQNETSFVWARQINIADDKDVFIAQTSYTSVDQFKKDNLIRFRDEVCRKYLFEDPEIPDSYLITETNVSHIPVQVRQTTFNGSYAVEMRGLWRTNNKSMGGPFIGYAMADEKAGKFYYIEGFTFSPSKNQREIIRELETILMTFNMKVPEKKGP